MPLDEFRAFPEQFFASKADRIDALGGLYDIKSAQAEIASMSRGFEQMRDRAAQACRMATLEARRKQMDALLDLDGENEFVIYLAPVGKQP